MGKNMLTRSELQLQAGLTRKALRIYEEKGLLVQGLNAKRQAVYRQEDVESAILIKSLRQAGVPIAQIEEILRPGPAAPLKEVDAIRDLLHASVASTHDALQKLETYFACQEKQVRKLRHGGYWALGTEAVVDKKSVADFVTEFAMQIRECGLDTGKFAARYENEQDSVVKVTCFKEAPEAVPSNLDDYKQYFIPEDLYYAVKAQGVTGIYGCFEGCYSLLEEARFEETAKPPRLGPIEIYLNYPYDQARGQTFEALLLN
ncbi:MULTISPECIES: MerR family transcriptional regulator [unclassified Roseibium]|uniref:MerR family transcriptional regulator n=1 Tax=unclassified Roseibium TaxID=2629323 RepID=UPI00319E5CEA